jgi:hypothetical protein
VANGTHHCHHGLGDCSPVSGTTPCTLAHRLLPAGSPPLQQLDQSLLKALGLWPWLRVSRVLKDLAAAAVRSGMARLEQIPGDAVVGLVVLRLLDLTTCLL